VCGVIFLLLQTGTQISSCQVSICHILPNPTTVYLMARQKRRDEGWSLQSVDGIMLSAVTLSVITEIEYRYKG
jgi:hypothetical protein